jgi:hypothetical protein
MKKNSIGVIAQMAARPKRFPKLGLTLVSPSFKPNDRLWMQLLYLKFSDPRYRDVLLPRSPIKHNTKSQHVKLSPIYDGTQILVEFVSGAKRNGSFYGAMFDKDGFFGQNKMGVYLMEIREIIRSGTPLKLMMYNPDMDTEFKEDAEDE